MSITNLINRSDLLRQIDTVVLLSFRTKKSDEFYKTILADVLSVINEVEAVEAEPVRHGRWEDITDGYFATCSVCGERWGSIGVMKYCPGCGAKMDEVE